MGCRAHRRAQASSAWRSRKPRLRARSVARTNRLLPPRHAEHRGHRVAARDGIPSTESRRGNRSLESRDRRVGSALLGMWVVTLTVLAAVAIARTAYIIRVDKAESSRFAIGPDGIIIGAATI